MPKEMKIFLRGHTYPLKSKRKRPFPAKQYSRPWDNDPTKWPAVALVIDCETTTDERQTFTFGSYRYCRTDEDGVYICAEEGFIYADDCKPEDLRTLKDYIAGNSAETCDGVLNNLKLLSRSEFIERVFWPVVTVEKGEAIGTEPLGMAVGFNLPFDLTRLALNCTKATRKRTWSLVMSEDIDPDTGGLRESPFRPRITITPRDSKGAFMKLTGCGIKGKQSGKRLLPYTPGRFLDLKTLAWALRNKSYTLDAACKAFNVAGKLEHTALGMVSLEEIEYCRQDVRATVDLLNALRTDFDLHPIELHPDKAVSPASIAKAYIKAMGIRQPRQKFDIPDEMLGNVMQTYYGGRAEAHIRHTVVPVVYTDFLSEYPTVNCLLGLWKMLIADRLEFSEATDEIQQLLANVNLDCCFEKEFWKSLNFFALIQPSEDIVPVRARYNDKSSNIGLNPLTTKDPIWFAGPDLIASILQSGRVPNVIQALRVEPFGIQAGLKSVRLRNSIAVDPTKDDFFQKVIEARYRVKRDENLPEAVRDSLSYFLKILANSGSYGLFVEVNTQPKPKKSRQRVRVFSGKTTFETTSKIRESPGRWYCPPLATLVTAGGRLLLSMLEGLVKRKDGTYLLCDTDSMAIVASENGGLVPCEGGPFRMPDGRATIHAVRWEEVREFVAEFDRLNPYDRDAVRESILKIEDVNFKDGSQREIIGYAIAAKRYALFTRDKDSIHIESAKGHGLGYLYPPRSVSEKRGDTPLWVIESWEWILRDALQLPNPSPPWFDLPAMMRYTITTSDVLVKLQERQKHLPYSERIKPLNFIQSPLIYGDFSKRNRIQLIASFCSDPSQWYDRPYINSHDGKPYRLAPPSSEGLPSQVKAKTYEDIVRQYRWHPEAKALGPDGKACADITKGLLQRTPVIATSFGYIGKETDRKWEQAEDISILTSEVVEYRPEETDKLVVDSELQAHLQSAIIRELARVANVSRNTVKAAMRGERLRKSKIDALWKAVRLLEQKVA